MSRGWLHVALLSTDAFSALQATIFRPILGLLSGVLAYFGLGLVRPELLQLAGNSFVIGPTAGAATGFLASFAERGTALFAISYRFATAKQKKMLSMISVSLRSLCT